jgi:hypothetical protein
MDERELARLEVLPDTVRVWRGTDRKMAIKGLSWTLDKERAIWFANRFHRQGYLVHGVVDKADIRAVFLCRNEDEVVSDKVRIERVEALPRPRAGDA